MSASMVQSSNPSDPYRERDRFSSHQRDEPTSRELNGSTGRPTQRDRDKQREREKARMARLSQVGNNVSPVLPVGAVQAFPAPAVSSEPPDPLAERIQKAFGDFDQTRSIINSQSNGSSTKSTRNLPPLDYDNPDDFEIAERTNRAASSSSVRSHHSHHSHHSYHNGNHERPHRDSHSHRRASRHSSGSSSHSPNRAQNKTQSKHSTSTNKPKEISHKSPVEPGPKDSNTDSTKRPLSDITARSSAAASGRPSSAGPTMMQSVPVRAPSSPIVDTAIEQIIREMNLSSHAAMISPLHSPLERNLPREGIKLSQPVAAAPVDDGGERDMDMSDSEEGELPSSPPSRPPPFPNPQIAKSDASFGFDVALPSKRKLLPLPIHRERNTSSPATLPTNGPAQHTCYFMSVVSRETRPEANNRPSEREMSPRLSGDLPVALPMVSPLPPSPPPVNGNDSTRMLSTTPTPLPNELTADSGVPKQPLLKDLGLDISESESEDDDDLSEASVKSQRKASVALAVATVPPVVITDVPVSPPQEVKATVEPDLPQLEKTYDAPIFMPSPPSSATDTEPPWNLANLFARAQNKANKAASNAVSPVPVTVTSAQESGITAMKVTEKVSSPAPEIAQDSASKLSKHSKVTPEKKPARGSETVENVKPMEKAKPMGKEHPSVTPKLTPPTETAAVPSPVEPFSTTSTLSVTSPEKSRTPQLIREKSRSPLPTATATAPSVTVRDEIGRNTKESTKRKPSLSRSNSLNKKDKGQKEKKVSAERDGGIIEKKSATKTKDKPAKKSAKPDASIEPTKERKKTVIRVKPRSECLDLQRHHFTVQFALSMIDRLPSRKKNLEGPVIQDTEKSSTPVPTSTLTPHQKPTSTGTLRLKIPVKTKPVAEVTLTEEKQQETKGSKKKENAKAASNLNEPVGIPFESQPVDLTASKSSSKVTKPTKADITEPVPEDLSLKRKRPLDLEERLDTGQVPLSAGFDVTVPSLTVPDGSAEKKKQSNRNRSRKGKQKDAEEPVVLKPNKKARKASTSSDESVAKRKKKDVPPTEKNVSDDNKKAPAVAESPAPKKPGSEGKKKFLDDLLTKKLNGGIKQRNEHLDAGTPVKNNESSPKPASAVRPPESSERKKSEESKSSDTPKRTEKTAIQTAPKPVAQAPAVSEPPDVIWDRILSSLPPVDLTLNFDHQRSLARTFKSEADRFDQKDTSGRRCAIYLQSIVHFSLMARSAESRSGQSIEVYNSTLTMHNHCRPPSNLPENAPLLGRVSKYLHARANAILHMKIYSFNQEKTLKCGRDYDAQKKNLKAVQNSSVNKSPAPSPGTTASPYSVGSTGSGSDKPASSSSGGSDVLYPILSDYHSLSWNLTMGFYYWNRSKEVLTELKEKDGIVGRFDEWLQKKAPLSMDGSIEQLAQHLYTGLWVLREVPGN